MPRPWLETETVARMLGPASTISRPRMRASCRSRSPSLEPRRYTRSRAFSRSSSTSWTCPPRARHVRVRAALRLAAERLFAGALRLVGSPYVWAGTLRAPAALFGRTLPGGFDCSGLSGVYKLEPFLLGAPAFSRGAQGKDDLRHERRGAALSACHTRERPTRRRGLLRCERHALEAERGRHMGIYAGSGWMVHSSDRGTTLTPMTGWYETRFAWARRPLAEAGLA